MHRSSILGLALLIGATAVQSVFAGTPNTTAAGAVSYEVGQGWVTQAVDEAAQDRWFTFTEVGGRSYCIEAGLGVATYFNLNPALTLYSDATGMTPLATNDDGASEPPMTRGSRICYMSSIALGTGSPATAVRTFKVRVPIAAGSGDSGFVRVRLVESTLVVFTASSGDSYTLSNTGTSGMTGAFYVPGVGKSSNIAISAQSRSNGQFSTLFTSFSGKVVYFFHDGPASVAMGRVEYDPAGSDPPQWRPFALRRD